MKTKTEKRKKQTNIVIEKEIEGYLGYFQQESCCKYFCLLGKGKGLELEKKNKERKQNKKERREKKMKKERNTNISILRKFQDLEFAHSNH